MSNLVVHDAYKPTSKAIKYRYNGVELPALPEWDKTKCPYAIIGISERYGTYALIINPRDWIMYDDTRWLNRFYDDGESSLEYILENGEWVLVNAVIFITPIWANFDVLNIDGSVFLEASDPVPVGGEPVWNGQTFYKVIGNKWVKHDAVVPAETLPEPEPIPIYGVEWDYSQSGTKLARTDDAVAFSDPAPATDLTATGTSPFDNVLPWSGMKRETLGTDEMVYIPQFYYKVTDDAENSKIKWQITYAQQEGFELHPGSGRYISRYHVSASYTSVSGATPTGGKTRATFRQNCHAKGDNWWMNDVATWSAIQILYLVEFADWNCQDALGYGQTSGATVATGATDTAVYHTIKRDGASNQYRWIENLYSNMRDWLDGSVNVSNRVWVGTNNAAYTDTTSGYTDTGLTIPTGSSVYPTKLGISDAAPWMFIPVASGGSGSTYIPDYSISGSNITMRVVGGKSSYSAEWGMFMYDSNDPVSFTAADVGARLIYIP